MYLPVKHSLALWVMLTFHISLKTSDFLVPIIFGHKKKFTKILKIHLNMYLNMYPSKFLDTERELDLVQSQVFLEVEKNPFSYHNLLTLNFNTDLGL